MIKKLFLFLMLLCTLTVLAYGHDVYVIRRFVSGDFDNDGFKDYAFINDWEYLRDNLYLSFNDGGPLILLDRNVQDVAAGDFDGDNNLDLVYTKNVGPINALYILFGNGDGTFERIIWPANGGQSLLVMDYDGDGRDDIIRAGPLNQLALFRSRGDRTFEEASYIGLKFRDPE